MILLREEVVEVLGNIDDPEELCADLIDAASMAIHDGDLSELEFLLEEFNDFLEVSGYEVQKSWREFRSEEGEEETE
jgi:hypothetical protein